MAVLVDSSVWISASSPKNKECLQLKRMIAKNELIYVAKPIQTEVCQGARSEAEFHLLWESFLGFNFLQISDLMWRLTAYNYFRCRKKGLTLSTLDCLVGTLASENKVPLWSLDKSFQRMTAVLGFELYSAEKR